MTKIEYSPQEDAVDIQELKMPSKLKRELGDKEALDKLKRQLDGDTKYLKAMVTKYNDRINKAFQKLSDCLESIEKGEGGSNP